jgi:uncharacterized protein (TIGR03435 family)
MVRFAQQTGGPGSNDPGRVRYPFSTVKNLLMIAYDVKAFQITGPSWLDSERFDVQATMPPDTSKEQFKIMLQNLIKDRFQAQIHRETKELPMYSMVVVKAGKMKESVETPPPTTDDGDPKASPPSPAVFGPGQIKFDSEGFPVLPGGAGARGGRGGFFQMMMPNRARLIAQKQTMQDLASRLSTMLSKPVTDSTGLSAKYDFILTYSPEGLNSGMMAIGGPPPGGGGGGATIGIAKGPGPADGPEVEAPPTIFAAMQSQLGLKLEAKKGPVEMIVVDKAEKTPTEN